MTTIVNNPPAQEKSNGPWGTIIVLIIVLVLGYLAYVYGLPAIQQMQIGTPTQINVPSTIDVNINN